MNSSVHAGIDFSKPDEGVEFRQLVENWFVDAVRELSDSALDPFGHSLDLTGREAGLRKSGVPLGAEGELWGSLWLTRVLKSGRKITGNVWSPKNWQTSPASRRRCGRSILPPSATSPSSASTTCSTA
jgi:hypothetical protein